MAERLILEEAIEHAKQIAKEKRKMSEEFWDYNDIHGVNKKQKAKCISCAEEHEQLAIWLAELKRYKDLEEQFGLVVLPCTVGTPIWYLGSEQNNETCEREYFIGKCGFELFMLNKLGKKYFLTKEEALAKLKERGEQ